MSDSSNPGTGANTPLVFQDPKQPLEQEQTRQTHRSLHNPFPRHDGSHTRRSHFHHNGHRIRHFFRPDGKKVHVASSPAEAEKMRKKLAVVEDDFDLVVQGTDEHVGS